MRSPRSTSSRRNAAQTFRFSVAVCTNPRSTFSPVIVMPTAATISSSANVLPSRSRATTS